MSLSIGEESSRDMGELAPYLYGKRNRIASCMIEGWEEKKLHLNRCIIRILSIIRKNPRTFVVYEIPGCCCLAVPSNVLGNPGIKLVAVTEHQRVFVCGWWFRHLKKLFKCFVSKIHPHFRYPIFK